MEMICWRHCKAGLRIKSSCNSIRPLFIIFLVSGIRKFIVKLIGELPRVLGARKGIINDSKNGARHKEKISAKSLRRSIKSRRG